MCYFRWKCNAFSHADYSNMNSKFKFLDATWLLREAEHRFYWSLCCMALSALIRRNFHWHKMHWNSIDVVQDFKWDKSGGNVCSRWKEPQDCGWRESASSETCSWESVWATVDLVQKSLITLIQCGCKIRCNSSCKCNKANLPCTELLNVGDCNERE